MRLRGWKHECSQLIRPVQDSLPPDVQAQAPPVRGRATSKAEILGYRDSATQCSIGPALEGPQWETSIGRVGAFAAWLSEAGKLQGANFDYQPSPTLHGSMNALTVCMYCVRGMRPFGIIVIYIVELVWF